MLLEMVWGVSLLGGVARVGGCFLVSAGLREAMKRHHKEPGQKPRVRAT